jgi:hypothetical protein
MTASPAWISQVSLSLGTAILVAWHEIRCYVHLDMGSPTLACSGLRCSLIGGQEKSMNFTVGLKHKGKVNHLVVDAEDALIAALKAKTEHPDATIMYVRPQNRRGDARHPPLVRTKDTR